MKRTAFFLLLLVACADGATVMGQRQGAPPQPGRQSGASPPAGQGAAPPARPAPQGRGGGRGAPVRDRAPSTGTASISGRVVVAGTGAPIRRAEVQASAGGNQPFRGVLTDENGRFELRDLPIGRWTVRAAKTGFLPQQFGQRNPFTASDPVVLAERQQFTADFALTRGGAITGRVHDEFGDPIASARVSALRLTSTANGRRLVGAGSSSITDDTGSFRIYGLSAGEYYVAANLTTTTANGLLTTAAGPVTYAPSYYPGTADIAAAQRVTLRAAEEQSGVTIALSPVRAVRVAGMVLGAAGAPIAARITLEHAPFADGGGSGSRSAGSTADGTFSIANVAPGTYVLRVAGRVTASNRLPEVAAVPLTVTGEDVAGLIVTTTHGAAISGSISAENGARVETSGIRVTAPPMSGSSQGSVPRAQVNPAGTFELSGLNGVHALRFEQVPTGWAIKSVTANGVEVADSAMEFLGSNQVAVRVILTDRLTELTGTIRSGNPLARGATVVVFPDDPAKWSAVSRYVRTARAGDDGQFTVRGLPPSPQYLAIALEYLENGEQLEPDFLQRMQARASRLSLSEGEKKTIDLDLVLR